MRRRFGRIGVNTGEVVAGDLGPGASFASGDAVNVAARLEQAAGDDEILLGQATRRLLGDAVEAEPVEPLELHGKSEPVDAFRLASVLDDAEAIVRHFETRFVGRRRELAMLTEAFEEALAEPGCRLVTALGEPGIGKTRLLSEFAGSLAGRVRVLTGHCLSYGKGITYWPLAEIVHQLSDGHDLAAGLSAELAGDDERERIVGLILAAIGASDREGSVEEVQWAVRRLFEALAAERPLVVVLEDLHWAEPTLLQLVEYVAGCSTGLPILLLTAAREELLDTSPGWALPHPHSRLLPLEPLPDAEAASLVDALAGEPLPDTVRARLLAASGGNPLFLEQFVALRAENGRPEDALPLPATITALLAARLDRLSTPERDVLERAAVEGVTFHRGTVTALLAEQETDVGALLVDAVRRNLIRSCESRLPHDEGYRFVHALVRDAVYQAMPKELRAQLHERFADRIEETLGSRSGELEEILGYHLEQAAHAKQELGRPDPALAERAGGLLARAGRRAMWRTDPRAAIPLLERAFELTRPIRLDVHLEVDLANMVGEGAYDLQRAIALADDAAARARQAGDEPGEALARVVAAHYRLLDNAETPGEVEALVRAALPLLEQAGDHAGLRDVWWSLGYDVCNWYGRFEEAAEAHEQALRHDRLAGDRRTGLLGRVEGLLSYGPRPASEMLDQIEQKLAERPSPGLLLNRAFHLALLGRLDEARALEAEAIPQYRALTDVPNQFPYLTAILAGDHESAARHLREICEINERQGALNRLSVYAPCLGRELCALGQYDKAERLAQRGRELAMPDDASAQMLWRQTQALVDSHRGRHAQAERLAREAVVIGEKTDALNWQGDALCDLAQVLGAAGKTGEAAEALEQGLERYRRKENLAMVARIQPRLEQLRGTMAQAVRAG